MAFYSVQSQLPPFTFTRRRKDGSYLSNWNLKRYNEYLQAKGDGSVTSGNRWNIRHRPSKESADKKLTVTPFLVDFQRILKSPDAGEVVEGVLNRELFHAAVALYDVSLPEITPEILYSTVTEKWARTILLVRDAEETADEYKLRFDKGKLGRKATRTQTKTDANTPVKSTSDNRNGTVDSCDSRHPAHSTSPRYPSPRHSPRSKPALKPSPRRDSKPRVSTVDAWTETEVVKNEDVTENPFENGEGNQFESWDTLWADSDDDVDNGSKFAGVFSDTSSTSGSQGDSEPEEEDLSIGVQTFFQNVERRRDARHQAKQGLVELKDVGIENRLVGCATIEKSYCRPGEKVIHLTLVAVHKRHRRIGVGRKLIELTKDTSLVGTFDAIVVHADNGATEFFKKEGFQDDLVINSQYSKVSDRWTNCTLMCYMPPFVGNTVLGSELKDQEVKAIQAEIDKWRSKNLEAYQALATAMARMNQEVLALRDVIKKQDESIISLQDENKKLQKSNHELRQSTREEFGVEGCPNIGTRTATDLNRQMLELTSVIREQVERRFGGAMCPAGEADSDEDVRLEGGVDCDVVDADSVSS